MKKKYTIKGEFWMMNDVRKDFNTEFEFEISDEEEQLNSDLAAILTHPWRLFTEGRKYGLNGIGRFVVLSGLFIFINLIFILSLVYEVLFNDAAKEGKGLMLGVCIAGFIFTLVAVRKAYKFMIVDLMRVVYLNNHGFFEGICRLIVEKASHMVQANNLITNDAVEDGLDIERLVHAKYDNMPKLMQVLSRYVLGKIPFHQTLATLVSEIKNQDKETVSKNLFVRMDMAIKESIFDKNNTRWVFWLFLLNLLVQVLLLSRV